MKQHGLLQSPLLAWGALAAGAVILALGVSLKIQTSRLGAAQEQLSACKSKNQLLNEQISRQNAAVKALALEAQVRVRRAQAASEAARRANLKARSEIERLRGLKPPVSGCPAQEAVKKIREGLQ